MAQHDVDWLRQRVDAGASVRSIATELGVTERTVRNRLSRAGIPLPRAVRDARIDVEALLAGYRAGTPVSHLANRYGVSSAWITRRVAEHGVERDVPVKRKPPPLRYAQLADRRWLLEQMADGRSVYAIARQLQTGARTVRDALRRHGLQWPPADADPVDRLAYIDDVEIRARATQRIVEDATALAKRARAVSDAADVALHPAIGSRFCGDLKDFDAVNGHRTASRGLLANQFGGSSRMLLAFEDHHAASAALVGVSDPDAPHETVLGLHRRDRDLVELLVRLIGASSVKRDGDQHRIHATPPHASVAADACGAAAEYAMFSTGADQVDLADPNSTDAVSARGPPVV